MQTIKLNNGIEMPVLGYGVFQVSPEECERCVLDAISTGYRLIDTAQAYYNEEGVGNAVARCGVPRNELFLTTKIWISNAGETNAARSIDESLRKLHTDYIDLLLIHQPFSDYPGTWRAMEKAVKDGKVRAIGLSNFYPDRFVDMAEYAEIKPAVNQLKTNVFSQQWEAEAEMNLYDTHIMAWAPLAQGNPELLTNPVLTALAERYNKTVQQVALRYLIQRDIIAIPKSTHTERMKQNLDVFDFALTPEDMESIRPLDKPDDFRWSHCNPELVKFLLNYDKQFNPDNKKSKYENFINQESFFLFPNHFHSVGETVSCKYGYSLPPDKYNRNISFAAPSSLQVPQAPLSIPGTPPCPYCHFALQREYGVISDSCYNPG